MTPAQALAAIRPVAAGANVRSELVGGPTSRGFLVARDHECWALRIDTPAAAALGLDRAAEAVILEHTYKEGIGPRLDFADAALGIQLTQFIPGRAWAADDLRDAANITRLAELLQRVHGIRATGAPFALRDRVSRYAALVGTQAAHAEAKVLNELLDRPEARNALPCLCHNDLVCTNVIDGNGLHLIDWEFAALGDPFFDLATVVEHHQLADDLAAQLLGAYTGRSDQADHARLEHWCQIYRRLLSLWERVVVRWD